MDQSLTVHESVAYNTTLGTGISTSKEDTAQMEIDITDDVITLSDRTMIQSNGGVSKSTNDFIDDLSDDDIELIVVKPKSKSRVPRPLSSTSYENHDGIEFIAQQSGFETQMALTPKLGYIKEYIKYNGLGIIFSMETGPVLFSTSHVWIDGEKLRTNEVSEHLKYGAAVKFVEKVFENEEYRVLSPDCTLRQAVVVWIGEKPPRYWRFSSDKSHLQHLAIDRHDFAGRVKYKDFLALDLVRSGGKIEGYLNEEFGIISTSDTYSGRRAFALFHKSDTFLYRDPVILSPGEKIYDILPVGLPVRFDAIRVDSNCRQVTHQACAVFVGAWPAVPHPTLLPGGEGTFSPCYDIPHSHTFYYLQLSLSENMEAKFRDFEQMTYMHREPLRNLFLRHGPTVFNYEDYQNWKELFVPPRFLNPPDSRDLRSVKRNYHIFSRETPIPAVIESIPFKVKKEPKVEESTSIKREPRYRVKNEN